MCRRIRESGWLYWLFLHPGSFVFNEDIFRWIERQKEAVHSAFRDKMPIDVEIDHVRALAESLMPDLRSNQEAIVCEQVEVEELRRVLAMEQIQLASDRDELLSLRALLTAEMQAAPDKIGQSAIQLRQSLKEAFERYRVAEDAFKVRENVLQFREDALSRAITKQNALLRRKDELELQVQSLESRMRLIDKDGVDNHMRVDRQKLRTCEELLASLKKRLTVAERLAEAERTGIVAPSLPDKWEIRGETMIEKEIDTYFQRSLNDVEEQ
ncbi:MAG: hypothetical protein U0996_25455 [Planctomycetaceae bacterium]